MIRLHIGEWQAGPSLGVTVPGPRSCPTTIIYNFLIGTDLYKNKRESVRTLWSSGQTNFSATPTAIFGIFATISAMMTVLQSTTVAHHVCVHMPTKAQQGVDCCRYAAAPRLCPHQNLTPVPGRAAPVQRPLALFATVQAEAPRSRARSPQATCKASS